MGRTVAGSGGVLADVRGGWVPGDWEDVATVTIDRPDGADGPPHVTFQRVPEAKTTKVRTHLDLFVEHAAPMVAEMVAAGATSLAIKEAGEWTTRVLQDPAGNEYCVIGPD